MSEDALHVLLAKRRDRAIAIILSVKEKECDAFLPQPVQSKLRKVVLDQLNDLCDFYGDLLKSIDNGAVFNEYYLDRLDQIHALLVGMNDG